MAITLANADKALKSFYLDAVSEQLNTKINPFFAAIEKSTNNVWGKEVRKLTTFGLNGGIGAGTEDGNLPTSSKNDYKEFVVPLKNLYGTIEISDKAIRASQNNSGAFVNLLNAEMESLIRSSKFNFGRMLFGDGSGRLATVTELFGDFMVVDDASAVYEGMLIDIYDQSNNLKIKGAMVSTVSKRDKVVGIVGGVDGNVVGAQCFITIQGSLNNEITGLKTIFDITGTVPLYGLDRMEHGWIQPYVDESVGELNELKIQTAIDTIEQESGNSINMIICSMGVRRAIQQMFSAKSRSLDTMELKGGYTAMSYNGIPIIADIFCPKGTMFLLNTNDFTLHQLCDWEWLAGDDGRILQQVAGKPIYTATLVKYAELICDRPNGQGMLAGITEK